MKISKYFPIDSNILIEYKNNDYKLIDMKGIVDDIFTLNGDKYYDYGKLLQSIIGYDLIIHNDEIDHEYMKNIKMYFLNKCLKENMNVNYECQLFKSSYKKFNFWQF
jgi:hypothetical protein